ncbi:hypothetical protein PENTCL1PPCAC_17311, partial [Pristionchus entomophagus]
GEGGGGEWERTFILLLAGRRLSLVLAILHLDHIGRQSVLVVDNHLGEDTSGQQGVRSIDIISHLFALLSLSRDHEERFLVLETMADDASDLLVQELLHLILLVALAHLPLVLLHRPDLQPLEFLLLHDLHWNRAVIGRRPSLAIGLLVARLDECLQCVLQRHLLTRRSLSIASRRALRRRSRGLTRLHGSLGRIRFPSRCKCFSRCARSRLSRRDIRINCIVGIRVGFLECLEFLSASLEIRLRLPGSLVEALPFHFVLNL